MSIDSMSLELIELSGLNVWSVLVVPCAAGMPSLTYSGSALAEI